MAYIVVQGLTLWDIHILALAEHWQRQSGWQADAWFEWLARFEALAALANLAYDHPDWSFPQCVDAGARQQLLAEGIGHPLLPDATRVTNDVQVGPPGRFLLVTGSNMSGKSTLLRSIGVNVVLAQAGAPVCATKLVLPPIRLGTSIRVQDSLGDGISLFLAELKRLKQVVDAAMETEAAGKRVFLYLLDEILHGTNTVERQIAIRRVMLHLLQHRAIGAISTHDLALAEVDPLQSSCQAVHFRETFRDGPAGHEMTFDYRLQPGVATTTNALRLLEMVGLSLNGEPAERQIPRKMEAG
jgi:DNA mismatch repair ATPase MutS